VVPLRPPPIQTVLIGASLDVLRNAQAIGPEQFCSSPYSQQTIFTRSQSSHLSLLCGFNPSHVQDIVMYAIIPEGWLTGVRRRNTEREKEWRRGEWRSGSSLYRDGNDNRPNLAHSSAPQPRLPLQKTIVLEKPTLSPALYSRFWIYY